MTVIQNDFNEAAYRYFRIADTNNTLELRTCTVAGLVGAIKTRVKGSVGEYYEVFLSSEDRDALVEALTSLPSE